MYKRFWLNKHKGRALMIVDVADDLQGKRHLDASVEVGDCGRSVNLDFDCNKKTRGEKLRKLRSMIEALQDVEKAVAGYKFGKAEPHEF